MPKCALNEDTNDPSDWEGTDDDNLWMRWRIKCKGWFAFANRCPAGVTVTLIFFPLLYSLPFTIWFTGWSWWYLFPVLVIPVARKWRLMPTTIIAIRGKGAWRLENTDSKFIVPNELSPTMLFPRLETTVAGAMTPFYLSRVQRWCRWHLAIQWPFLIQGHFYLKVADVPTPATEHDTDGQLVNGYRGWHRDEDQIYWGDGAFFGTVFK